MPLEINPEGRCYHCGRPIKYRDKFCVYCGEPNNSWAEITEKQCGNCRADLVDGAKFCCVCGTKVGDGLYEPYQPFMECLYGPIPNKRKNTCKKCNYEWETHFMELDVKFCPKCGKTTVESHEMSDPNFNLRDLLY